MFKFKPKLFLITLILFLVPTQTFAASLVFQPQGLSLPQLKPFTVTITLDTQGENLNAIDGTVLVSKELGSDIIVTDSGSVVTYWVTRPEYDKSSRAIKFSGTIPGGFSGTTGILFSVVIPAYSGGRLDNAITVTDVHGYLNDGLGTQAKISTKQFVLGDGSTPQDPAIADQLYVDPSKPDNIPPEIFSPQVSRDDRVFDGQWFISFATTDKQSGVDRYEVQESLDGSIDSGRWKIASSPYVLTDQELHSYIFITAIDRQGNERIIKVYPRNPQSWWFRYGNAILILSGLIVILLIGYFINKRRNNNQQEVKKINQL